MLLHPADRLMVQLIKIPRLAPRIEGMLYRARFEERISMLEEVRIGPVPVLTRGSELTVLLPPALYRLLSRLSTHRWHYKTPPSSDSCCR